MYYSQMQPLIAGPLIVGTRLVDVGKLGGGYKGELVKKPLTPAVYIPNPPVFTSPTDTT